MTENCFEIGAFQAFLDGELTQAETMRVSSHVANCDACAAMLAAAEDESAIVFPALDREFNTLVPTQRLWTRINDSIALEAGQAPFWRKIFSFVNGYISTPSLAMAASLLLIFGLFATVWISRISVPVSEPGPTRIAMNNPARVNPSADVKLAQNDLEPPAPVKNPERVSVPQDENRTMVSKASYTAPKARPAIRSAGSVEPVADEENYVKTIASLSHSVSDQKDSVLRPAERVAFERDLAVVDDAITKMKTEVKKNPKNESAKQVLYSSYQNKIDLLNSVSQKQELMASLR